MFLKVIDTEKCTSCMLCESICTNSRVIAKNEQGMPEFRYENRCIYCGHCLAVCPEGAITFGALPNQTGYCAQTVEPVSDSVPSNPQELFNFLSSTRSTRIFTHQPVEREKLETIIDAMIRASSAGNEQNRNFYVVSNAQTLDTLERALVTHYEKTQKLLQNPVSRSVFAFLGALRAKQQSAGLLKAKPMPFRKRYRLVQSLLRDAMPPTDSGFSYLKHAPVLILITRGKKNSAIHKAFYRGDACISATYGILMAKALGLAACWMGLLEIALQKNKKLGKLIPLKAGERLDAAFVIGYSDTRWHRLPPRGPVDVTWLV